MSNKSLLDYTVELNDGSRIPALGLGTVPPEDKAKIADIVKVAIRSGVRHIDTAWYYQSEPYIGQVLKELFESGEIKREDLFITTKVWPSLWNKVEYSVKKSLNDLGIEYADLVLQHWPTAFKGVDENGLPAVPYVDGVVQVDEEADYLDTFKQLIKLRDETNLIKRIGVSNFREEHLDRAIAETGVVPVINQVELHPNFPQKKLVKYFEDKGVKITAYAPFGSTGAPLLKDELIQELANKYNVGGGSVALSYHVLSGRTVVSRTSNPERAKHLDELAPLTEEDIARLDNLGVTDPKRYGWDDWVTKI